jgi:hypothetical protein
VYNGAVMVIAGPPIAKSVDAGIAVPEIV